MICSAEPLSPILSIKTGHAFSGGRFGLIEASPAARPGSLNELTRFLHEQGIRTLPGTTGPDAAPVLRLSGFSSRHVLDGLLQREFPQWQQRQFFHGSPIAMPLAVPVGMGALGEARAIHRGIGATVRGFGKSLPGACYFASDAGLLYSGIRSPVRDGLKVGAGASYVLAAANLAWFAGDPATPSVQAMMGRLNHELDVPTVETLQSHAHAVLRQHPWEISGLFNLLGAGLHTLSSLHQTVAPGAVKPPLRRLETVCIAGGLVSMALQTFVPAPGADPLLDLSRLMPTHTHEAARRLISHHPVLHPLITIAHYIGGHPIQVAGGLSAAANIGCVVSAMHRPQPDAGLLASSLLCLAGNGAQILTSPRGGANLDDVTTAASDLLASRHETSGRKIDRAASILARTSGLSISQRHIRQAIVQRLELRRTDDGGRDGKSELADNPFLPSRFGQAERNGGLRMQAG